MGVCHSFGTVGAKMEVWETRTSEEVFWYEGVVGATRRDRTGDLLITNQPLYQLS